MATARNYPGMTAFQVTYQGSTPKGWSGVVQPLAPPAGMFTHTATIAGVTFGHDVNYAISINPTRLSYGR